MAKNSELGWHALMTTYKVGDFVNWYRQGDLDLSPFFQRNSVWKVGAKSLFIDTIIKGYPVPMIFLRDKRPNLKNLRASREVVDGQQRIRTLISYIEPKLLGKSFDPSRDKFTIWKEHNEEFQGKSYSELPDEIQSRIWDYQFSVSVFPSDTADSEVTQIFARMNASGYKLNAQELRNAEYFGAFKTLAYRLSAEQLPQWREWRVFSADGIARMNDVELTSELMIVILQGITEKTADNISEFYERYDPDFPSGREVAKRFRTVMETITESLSDHMRLFRKKTMFYALFAAIYDLQYGIQSDLKTKGGKDLSPKAIKALCAAAGRVADGAAPKTVMDATYRRVSHARERERLATYLSKHA